MSEIKTEDVYIPLGGRPSSGFLTDEMVLQMGPQHPSTHGVLRLECITDGEIMKKVTPYIGYLHRCFEKHCENEPWPAVIPYCDRMDYVASMGQSFSYVVTVEKIMEIEVPERAEYIRIITAELQRIASHLIAFGTYGLDMGAFTPFLWAFRERELILDMFEKICGARLLYNYMWIGGVSHDLYDGFVPECMQVLDLIEKKIIEEYNPILTYNKIFVERLADVGVLKPETAIDYGITGPALRGSGVDWDIRRDEPYSLYDRFDFDVILGKGEMGTMGDCWDRYYVRMFEMIESIKIIRQALQQLPDGEIMSEKIGKNVRVPVGKYYGRTEAPRGELGYYIISEKGKGPTRLKGRSPCFCNLSVIDDISRGYMLADLVAIIGSLDIVLGCVDR
ncbi:NADH-quinone oxidoreductase subunit D [candidate division KSB1 bacterium]